MVAPETRLQASAEIHNSAHNNPQKLQELVLSLGETRERILWLWSGKVVCWLCVEVIADEIGISIRAAEELLALLVEAGILRRIDLTFGFHQSARWNLSELGSSLVDHLLSSCVTRSAEVSR